MLHVLVLDIADMKMGQLLIEIYIEECDNNDHPGPSLVGLGWVVQFRLCNKYI